MGFFLFVWWRKKPNFFVRNGRIIINSDIGHESRWYLSYSIFKWIRRKVAPKKRKKKKKKGKKPEEATMKRIEVKTKANSWYVFRMIITIVLTQWRRNEQTFCQQAEDMRHPVLCNPTFCTELHFIFLWCIEVCAACVDYVQSEATADGIDFNCKRGACVDSIKSLIFYLELAQLHIKYVIMRCLNRHHCIPRLNSTRVWRFHGKRCVTLARTHDKPRRDNGNKCIRTVTASIQMLLFYFRTRMNWLPLPSKRDHRFWETDGTDDCRKRNWIWTKSRTSETIQAQILWNDWTLCVWSNYLALWAQSYISVKRRTQKGGNCWTFCYICYFRLVTLPPANSLFGVVTSYLLSCSLSHNDKTRALRSNIYVDAQSRDWNGKRSVSTSSKIRTDLCIFHMALFGRRSRQSHHLNSTVAHATHTTTVSRWWWHALLIHRWLAILRHLYYVD